MQTCIEMQFVDESKRIHYDHNVYERDEVRAKEYGYSARVQICISTMYERKGVNTVRECERVYKRDV